jgi:hypothetical protein
MHPLDFLALCDVSITVRSLQITHSTAVFAIVMLAGSIAVSITRRSLAWLPLCAAFVLAHPAWTMKTLPTDCGLSVRFLAIATSVILTCILFFQIFRALASRRRFLIGVCCAAWIGYFLEPYYSAHWAGIMPVDLIEWKLGLMAAAEGPLESITLALSAICFLQWIWHRRRNQASNGESKITVERRLICRMVTGSLAIFFLGAVIVLLSEAQRVGYPPRLNTLLYAITLSSIFLIATVIGRFPGWN